MATHSSILAWRIPWTEEPGGLQSTGSRRVRHDGSDLACTVKRSGLGPRTNPSTWQSSSSSLGSLRGFSRRLQGGRVEPVAWCAFAQCFLVIRCMMRICAGKSWKGRRRQWHPLQYSCLENPMDGGAWWVAVHGVAKSRTQLSNFHFSLSRIGEGHGNPLQCSCLENPRDGGAWWAAVCGVAESDTTDVT